MAIKLDSGFEILYLSDVKYEYMTVEIQYHGQQVAQINKDCGIDKMEIEIYQEFIPGYSAIKVKTNLNDFINTLEIAAETLKDL